MTTAQATEPSLRRPLTRLSFLHIVPFERDAPAKGLNDALELFEYAEALGLDGGWIRTRHLQYGMPSAAVFLAAASQRTRRIDLGVAVIPTVYESPLRLAEDLAVADLLSGGRLQPGLSVGAPRIDETAAERVLGSRWREDDISYGRVERILDFVRGAPVLPDERRSGPGERPANASNRIEPHSPGLAGRIWYGGGSLRSAAWAGSAGLKLLVSNISTAEDSEIFATAQRQQIDLFRSHHPLGGSAVVSQGHVIVPTDHTTRAQREKYTAYVESRTPRTRGPQGAGRTLIAPDITGSTDDIVRQLSDDVAFQAADEFLFELPFEFEVEDYRHIIREIAMNVGPALGWIPRR